jgi:hypothetical protein
MGGMMKSKWILALLLLPMLAFGQATYYVSPNMDYRAIVWGVGGLPVQPSAYWYLADGVDHDTLNFGGAVRNRGDSLLSPTSASPAGLTMLNPPGLDESPVACNQSSQSFNGAANYLYINDGNILDVTTGDISMACWFKTATPTVSQRLMGKRGAAAGYSFAVSTYLTCGTQSGVTPANTSLGTTTLVANKWYFGTMAWDATAKKTWLFLNGAYEDTTIKDQGTLTNAGANFAIGATTIPGTYFNGDIACAMFWKGTCLTPAQVAAVYAKMSSIGASTKPFPSLQAAADYATAGDTIKIGAGQYQETRTGTKALIIQGQYSGFGLRPVMYGANLPAAAGITAITCASAAKYSYLDIVGYSAGYGVSASSTSDGARFDHLTIDSCKYAINIAADADGDSVLNCTLDGELIGSGVGYAIGHAHLNIFENNIVYGFATGMSINVSATLTEGYNDFYANTNNYSGALATTDLTFPPNFKNPAANDYRPRLWALKNGGVTWWGGSGIGAWSVLPSSNQGGPMVWGRIQYYWGRAR